MSIQRKEPEASTPLLVQGEAGGERHPRINVVQICVGFVATILAAGVVSTFMPLQPLLISVGVFGDECTLGPTTGCSAQYDALSLLYTVTSGASVGGGIVAGLIFDRTGPRGAAIIGALGCVVGLLGIGVASAFPALNSLLFVFFPLTDLCGYLNSFALSGFVYAKPAHMSLIIGLSAASYQASGLLSLVMVGLSRWMSVPWTFAVFAAAALVSALVSLWAFPSQKHYFAMASEVLGVPMGKESRTLWRRVVDMLGVMGNNPVENGAYVGNLVATYTYMNLFPALALHMWTEMFAKTEAFWLADIWGLLNGFGGMVLSPCMGHVVDHVGIVRGEVGVGLLLSGWLAVLWWPHTGLQIASMCLGVAYLSAWSIFLQRWTVATMPADLIGTTYGVLMSLCGVLQLGLNAATEALVPASGLSQFLVPLGVWGAVDAVSTAVFVAVLIARGVPEFGDQQGGK